MISRQRACEVFEARLKETGDIAEALLAVAREGAAAAEARPPARRGRSRSTSYPPVLAVDNSPKRNGTTARQTMTCPRCNAVPSAELLHIASAVIAEVALAAGITVEEVGSRRRKPAFVDARSTAMLALNRLDIGPVAIARAMRLDHATVIYGLDRAACRPDLVKRAERVLARLERTAGERRAA